jgi:SAM-dependent methyltransferase
MGAVTDPDPDRDALKLTFEQVPELYDRARPAYPIQLFEDLIELARVQPDSLLLEIGCGTGKATVPLAERGFRIVCLEIGPALASFATRKLTPWPRARVIEAPFETWPAPEATFDLVYAATSWHWLHRDLRYPRAAELLKDGGALAFFAAVHAFPPDTDSFFFDIQEVYEAIGEVPRHEQWPPVDPDRIADESDEILASGFFETARVRRYLWEQQYSAAEYIDLLGTFSSHIAMAQDKQDFLYAEIHKRISARPGRSVRRHWLTILHVARRRSRAMMV